MNGLATIRARLRFLNDRAPHARYVTSVCTGSLILAAAGLLNGYRAATHWAARDILALFDVEVVTDRVVIDRNRMTGGGVTTGIDFGLTLLSILRDENIAQLTQLQLEHAPQPPYTTGTPETAGPELVASVQSVLEKVNAQITQAAEEVCVASGKWSLRLERRWHRPTYIGCAQRRPRLEGRSDQDLARSRFERKLAA